jgi:tRNA (guanine37-N1)-methyltransferase
MLRIDIITIFPEVMDRLFSTSVIGRGREKKLFDLNVIDLRSFAVDRHKTVDDTRFGGGGGMVLKPEPLAAALDSLGMDFDNFDRDRMRIVLTSATGKIFDQEAGKQLSLLDRLVIICGHYKGVDERILELYPVDEVSVGDFVLTGGEPATWVLVDAVVRLIPGVMGNFESAIDDSFTEDHLLGAPVYTRPAEFRGLQPPPELLTGDHARIKEFRRKMALRKTVQNRPELLEKADLTAEEIAYIKSLDIESESEK